MRKYSILTVVIPLPTQAEMQPGQTIPISVTLPDNAIPLQLEYHPAFANAPATCALHYLVPISNDGIPLCEICNERPAEFEGVICFQCKQEQDEFDIKEDMKASANEAVKENHKGEHCWLKPKTLCQEGWCNECQIFLDWIRKYGI